jgi:NitT/TauT family transport system substrate-binding protein
MGKTVAFLLVAVFMMTDAWAEAPEVRVAQQYGVGYLPLMVMEQRKLIEKYAQAAGLQIKVVWAKYPGGKEMNDALLTGKLDFASGGLAPLLSIWSSTKGSANVRGVGSMNTMPLYLNTRNPNIKSIRDFTKDDRIALPGVKTSIQAVTLEMAAAAEWGDKNFDKLDAMTVSMSHPDATKALVSGTGGITAHFSSPPFQYDQLKQPGIHTVTTSYEILTGASSFNLVWTTTKFHDENPKLYRAFADAMAESIDWIKLNKQAAAELYVTASKDKIPPKAILDMLSDVYILFTMAPKNIYRYSKFMYRIGQIKNQPDGWEDVFFSNVHGLYGS